jgi:hypothetical protein
MAKTAPVCEPAGHESHQAMMAKAAITYGGSADDELVLRLVPDAIIFFPLVCRVGQACPAPRSWSSCGEIVAILFSSLYRCVVAAAVHRYERLFLERAK